MRGREKSGGLPAAKRAIGVESGSNGGGAGRKSDGKAGNMATVSVSDRINDLIMDEQWVKARALIERELAREPKSHWLLTQLGETYYEQKKYKRALGLLLKSLEIVPDCPLTLWHLAGTLDALGDSSLALRIYTWILESQKSADEDPCWESDEFSDALKTDSVFRIGICFTHLGRKQKAKESLRRYIDLLVAGAKGSYPIQEAMQCLRELGGQSKPNEVEDKLRIAATSMSGKSNAVMSPRQPHPDWKSLQRRIARSMASASR